MIQALLQPLVSCKIYMHSHLIDLKGALPVLFGDNIGTTITAIIASLGANIAAKRVAGAM